MNIILYKLLLTTLQYEMYYLMPSMRFTRFRLLGCTRPCTRKWRLRLFDFLVSKWLLNALYLRILPVPVTLNVFLARECVFTFGML